LVKTLFLCQSNGGVHIPNKAKPEGKEVRKMAEEIQVQPTGKKKGDCGCGCIGISEKKAKGSKPAVKNPEK
jgi:hypothetical protein